MDPLSGALTAAVAIHAALGMFFIAARIRLPDESDYGVYAVLSAAVAALGGAELAELHATSAASLAAASRLATVALIAVTVLYAHFTLEYARIERRRRTWLGVAYGAGALLEIADARGLLHEPMPATVAMAAGLPRWVPLSPLGISVHALAVALAGTALALFALNYLAGRKEALALVVGGTVVTAGLLNDLGFAAGRFATTYVGSLAFLGLGAGLLSTVLSRLVRSTEETARRADELRTRSRELRKALSDLDDAREELGKKEQLAVVGELAAVIAHEVRNPLAIIANAVAGLRKTTLKPDDQATLLSILEEETSRLNRLVSDLLRYARPVNLQRQSISLRDLLERGLQIVGTKKQIHVELAVEAPDMRLWGDGNLLRQVFDNLIDNAVQAMQPFGTLTVRVRAMTHEGSDGLAVDIIDTGEGMDTIVRSRARDPFFTTRPSGTGLGLAIVDRIVDAHGGHFLIESRTGEGTTATVFLPAGSPSEPPPRSRGPTRRSSSPRIGKTVKVG